MKANIEEQESWKELVKELPEGIAVLDRRLLNIIYANSEMGMLYSKNKKGKNMIRKGVDKSGSKNQICELIQKESFLISHLEIMKEDGTY